MLSLIVAVAVAGLAELPVVEVEPLAASRVQGKLVSLSASEISFEAAGQSQTLELSRLLSVKFGTSSAEAAPGRSAGTVVLTLTDGTQLWGSDLRLQKNTASLSGHAAGEIKLPLTSISNVQFGRGNAKAQTLWSDLTSKEAKKDLLVIRKGEGADYLSGVLGDLEDKLKFVLDGDEVPVSREKIFGLIYSRRSAPRTRAIGELSLSSGDLIQVSRLQLQAEGPAPLLEVDLPTGLKLKLPLGMVQSLNLSVGKLKYLSQLEWKQLKYTPWIDEDFPPLKDRALGNRPLSIAGQTFSRGLWIHSRSLLTYRLNGEYRRLQAVMGIDDQGQGEVDVTIRGDGRELFRGPVTASNPAIPLDLDLENVRELEIFVDFGPKDYGPGDHLVLGDARLLK